MGREARAHEALNTKASQEDMAEVTIYTDGAAKGNPGPAGYGAVLVYEGPEGETSLELSQGYERTTNNRMEMMAVIAALEQLTRPCKVTLYSDSQYVVAAHNENWILKWKMRDWKNSDKKPVANRDLWEKMIELETPHAIEFIWVRGHAGNAGNELSDKLASEAAKNGPYIKDEGFQEHFTF